MNKIKVDDSHIIIDHDDIYFLELTNECSLSIDINPSVVAKLVLIAGDTPYSLVFNVLEKASLTVNSLNKDVNSRVLINLEANSTMIYNHSVFSQKDSLNNFIINHIGEKTSLTLNNNGINLGSCKLYFEITGIIPKKSNQTISNQHSKIINATDGDSKIIPNFVIDNNDISANHSAYIGNFPQDVLFYVSSRGISREEMYHLLYRSLILGSMSLDAEKELFNKILKEWGLL